MSKKSLILCSVLAGALTASLAGNGLQYARQARSASGTEILAEPVLDVLRRIEDEITAMHEDHAAEIMRYEQELENMRAERLATTDDFTRLEAEMDENERIAAENRELRRSLSGG